MKLATYFFLAGALAILLLGCQKPENQDQGPLREPKTSFGKNVKSAKDVSKEVSKNDEEVRRQAAKLVEE